MSSPAFSPRNLGVAGLAVFVGGFAAIGGGPLLLGAAGLITLMFFPAICVGLVTWATDCGRRSRDRPRAPVA